MRTRPGWYPDPSGAPVLRAWDGQYWTPYTSPYPVRQPPLLDREIAALKVQNPPGWGARPIVLPLAGYAMAITIGTLAAYLIDPATRTGQLAFAAVANISLDAIVVTAAYYAGNDIARRAGGWGRAFGWCRPRWKDALIALAAVGIVFAGRIVIGIVVLVAGGEHVLRESQNLRPERVDAGIVVLLVVVAGLAAPVIEELVFRGLLLRTFMMRMSFWPAAVASSTIFAIGHTYEVSTLGGAAVLAVNAGLIGLVNCGLVRYTGRLAPGIIAHAIFNLTAILLLAGGAVPA